MKNFNTFLRNDLFEISIGKLSESCLSTSVVDIRKKGHEAGGIVTAVGSKVTTVKIGDKVAIGKLATEYFRVIHFFQDPNRGCHGCEHCRRSNPHFCPKGSFNDAIGIIRNGGFAPYCVAPVEQVYKG